MQSLGKLWFEGGVFDSETPLLGRTVQPYVDAAHQCLRGDPSPTHAGLANHQCEIPP
jgi:hypothetical protein